MRQETYREYFVAQNTGFSGGRSWFDNSGDRHKTFRGACIEAQHFRSTHPEILSRVVKIEEMTAQTVLEVASCP